MRIVYFLIPRLLVAALTIFGVSLLVFISLRLIPGEYADIILGPFVSPEMRAMLSSKYGLNDPIVIQFFKWFGALLTGDFGVSMATNKPVLDEMLRRAPVTAQLACMTLILAVGIGFPLGLRSGLSASAKAGRGSGGRLVGAMGASVPDFVIGSALIFIFSKWSLGLKVGGYVPLSEGVFENLKTMVLPTISLSVFGIALILRTTRDSVLRTMTEGHILAAIGRGEPPARIVQHHVVKNAAIPIVTVVATYFGFLLGGTVIAEVLFSIPGIGYYIFSSLEERDYAVVQAGVMLAAFVFVFLNMLADLTYALLDPRIGSTKSKTS